MTTNIAWSEEFPTQPAPVIDYPAWSPYWEPTWEPNRPPVPYVVEATPTPSQSSWGTDAVQFFAVLAFLVGVTVLGLWVVGS